MYYALRYNYILVLVYMPTYMYITVNIQGVFRPKINPTQAKKNISGRIILSVCVINTLLYVYSVQLDRLEAKEYCEESFKNCKAIYMYD